MITLGHGYHIGADSENYILLQEKTNNKTGVKRFETIGYYDTLESSVKGYAKHTLRDLIVARDMTLKEAINLLVSLERDLIGVIDNAVLEVKTA